MLGPLLCLAMVVDSFICTPHPAVLGMRSPSPDRDAYCPHSLCPHCYLHAPSCWPTARCLLPSLFAHPELLGQYFPKALVVCDQTGGWLFWVWALYRPWSSLGLGIQTGYLAPLSWRARDPQAELESVIVAGIGGQRAASCPPHTVPWRKKG